MNRFKSFAAVSVLIMSVAQSAVASTGHAHSAEGSKRVCDGFMPENNLHLFDNVKSLAGITEAEFNARIDEVAEVYGPIVDGHGAKLVFGRNWTDSTVNAYADQKGKTWAVEMFGGLARRPEVTADGFSLVVCHEVGHHLAGYPFYKGFLIFPPKWAATEGQSDYFATQACAKLLWSDQRELNAQSRENVPAAVQKKCDAIYKDTDEQNLCYRSAIAGQSLAKLLSALNSDKVPAFDTPDTSVVSKVFDSHPKGQCRLDTYVAGALCNTDFERTLIPGKNGNNGSNNNTAEQIAEKYSCGGKAGSAPGVRPACWFKSRLN